MQLYTTHIPLGVTPFTLGSQRSWCKAGPTIRVARVTFLVVYAPVEIVSQSPRGCFMRAHPCDTQRFYIYPFSHMFVHAPGNYELRHIHGFASCSYASVFEFVSLVMCGWFSQVSLPGH